MPAVIEGYARPLEIASFLSKFLQTATLRRTRQPANDPPKLSPQKNADYVTQANSFPFITASSRIGTKGLGQKSLCSRVSALAREPGGGLVAMPDSFTLAQLEERTLGWCFFRHKDGDCGTASSGRSGR